MTLILLSGIVAVAEYRRAAIVLAVLSFIAIVLRWSEWFVSETLLPGLLPASATIALLILAFAVGTTVLFPTAPSQPGSWAPSSCTC